MTYREKLKQSMGDDSQKLPMPFQWFMFSYASVMAKVALSSLMADVPDVSTNGVVHSGKAKAGMPSALDIIKVLDGNDVLRSVTLNAHQGLFLGWFLNQEVIKEYDEDGAVCWCDEEQIADMWNKYVMHDQTGGDT